MREHGGPRWGRGDWKAGRVHTWGLSSRTAGLGENVMWGMTQVPRGTISVRGIVICRAGKCRNASRRWCWGRGIDNEFIPENTGFETLGDVQVDMARRQLEVLFRTEGEVNQNFSASALVTFESR